jgi:hypothetical protein
LSVIRLSRRRYEVVGHLLGRLGLRRAAACQGARALLTVKVRRRKVAAARVRVRRDCSYSSRLALRRPARRPTFSVRFEGRRAVTRLRARRTVRR